MLAALLAGFVIGTVFGAYLLYAVVPSASMSSGATPRDLYYDPAGNFPQYRDYYAARAAARFAAMGGAANEQALSGARDELGITTGEVTPSEAVEMVRAAQSVAAKENTAELNPDAGRFTLQDQQNLAALGDRLNATQGDLGTGAAGAASWRDLIRIGGLIGLAVLILLAALVLWLINRGLQTRTPTDGDEVGDEVTPTRTSTRTSARTSARTPTRSAPRTPLTATDAGRSADRPATSTAAPRSRSAEPPDVTADAPLADAAPASTAFNPLVDTGVDSERIGTYDTVYVIGEDRYDDSFPIHGSMGELIGECGASIVERVGLDSPARVVAVAVWLFDKGDFQSTTKILLTDFAFTDTAVRDKLRNRGDAVQVRMGVIDIVTSSLRIDVEVTALNCAPIGGVSNGYFEKLGLQFRVYRK